MITDHNRSHLERLVQLAANALNAGDAPFGSILVSANGTNHSKAMNEVGWGDVTQHPEFAIACWAATHLASTEREAATVCTAGKDCPVCSVAHA